MGYDLYPMDTLAFKRAFAREAIEREYLIFFEHDPSLAAGRLRERRRANESWNECCKSSGPQLSGGRYRGQVHYRGSRQPATGDRLQARGQFMRAQIGIIGGSGLYDMAELTDREQHVLTTPFGDPSGRTRWRRCAASASRFWRGTATGIG